MTQEFRLLMLGAMYENGGNTTHRFLDGHPGLFTYPFESQIGTRLVNDALTSMFPVKYRWPVFSLDATPLQDYRAIIDEEGKVRARTPHVSKFRHMPFDMNDDARAARYQHLVRASGRSTGPQEAPAPQNPHIQPQGLLDRAPVSGPVAPGCVAAHFPKSLG